MKEEDIVAKTGELMETLDEIKRYDELAKSLQRFSLIVLGSIVALFAMMATFAGLKLYSVLGRFDFVLLEGSILFIPLLGTLLLLQLTLVVNLLYYFGPPGLLPLYWESSLLLTVGIA